MPATLLVLPAEIVLQIAEECIGYGWFHHVPDAFGPRLDMTPTFKRSVGNLGLVCKDLREKTIEIQLRHIQVKAPAPLGYHDGGVVHDYHRTTYERKSGYFEEAEKNIRAMLKPCSPITDVKLSEKIQTITLELPTPDHNKDNLPTGGLVDGLYHLLKSAKCLKTVKLHLAAQKSPVFRRRFDMIRKNLGDDANFSKTIQTLALGRHCEFLIPFCPGVKHIAGYGNEWFLNRFPAGTRRHGHFKSAAFKLIDAAGAVAGLESFELMGKWGKELLDRMLGTPHLGKIKSLNMVGRIKGRGPMPDLVTANSRERSVLRRLQRFPNLETIVLPGNLPAGLFQAAFPPVNPEVEIFEHFQGFALFFESEDDSLSMEAEAEIFEHFQGFALFFDSEDDSLSMEAEAEIFEHFQGFALFFDSEDDSLSAESEAEIFKLSQGFAFSFDPKHDSLSVQHEGDISQHFQGLTLFSNLGAPGGWVAPGELPRLPSQDFFPPLPRKPFWECDDGIYKPLLHELRLNAFFDRAYLHLAIRLGLYCPKLQTLWIDRLYHVGRTSTPSEGLTFAYETMTRDVRIKFEPIKLDSVDNSFVIDRTLLRKRATDGDTKVYGYDSIQ